MDSKKNIIIYYTVSFLTACIFLTPIWSFFFVNYLHFSFGTALFITVFSGLITFIFEVPSGAWADKFGRKKTYIIGILIILFGYSFYLWADFVRLFIIAAFLQGVGNAMISGNLESLVHDELIINNNKDRFQSISSRSYVFLFVGKGLSSLFAGYLFSINVFYPIYLTIFSYLLTFILILFIETPNYHKPQNITNFEQIKNAWNFVINERMVWIFLILIFLQNGLGNVYYFTYQPYLKDIGFTVGTIGIVFSIISFLSATGSFLINKIQDKYDPIGTARFMLYLLFIISILFYFLDTKLGLIPVVLLAIISGFTMPLGNNFLAGKVESDKKATVLSIYSFIITLGYFTFASIAGFLVDIVGLKTVYFGVMFLSFMFLIVDKLYFYKLNKYN